MPAPLLRLGAASRPKTLRRAVSPAGNVSLRLAAGLLVLLCAGCKLIQSTAELPFQAMGAMIPGMQRAPVADPVEVQEQLLRFSDSFIAATVARTDRLRRDDRPIERTESLRIKLAMSSDALAVATGSNALAALVDMVVLTTITRIRLEHYWLPKVYGESARSMLEAVQALEGQIADYARTILRPEQEKELRDAIERWRRERAQGPAMISSFVTIGLVSEVARSGRARNNLATSVFALLDIDPLAGLDPATRELAQTRLFAERALYLGQRMPQMLDWQVELFTLRTAALPQVRQALDNTAQLAAAGDRLSRVAEQTPAFLSGEREQILAALKSQKEGLTLLSREVGETLGRGAKMADSTNAALKTFQGVVAQLTAGPQEPRERSSEPFRIKDYAETAEAIGGMAQRLAELLGGLKPALDPETFARLSAQAEAVAARTQARGQDLVDYAFRKALILVALSAVLALAAGLAFRFLAARLGGALPDANGKS